MILVVEIWKLQQRNHYAVGLLEKMQRTLQKNEKLLATIRDRNTLLFQGEVTAISSLNDKGPFDVLPQHENFISLIKQAVVIHLPNKQEKRIDLESGVLKVKNNNVEIYLGILRR